MTRSHRMILMCKRRTEDCHNAVAHNLIYCALVTVYGFHHSLNYRTEKFARVFRITIREELHGLLYVGKQHGDLLALAFERTFRPKNLFGEMLWSVGFDGCEVSFDYHRCRRSLELLSALLAKPRIGAGCRTAFWAADSEPRAAAPAEYGVA